MKSFFGLVVAIPAALTLNCTAAAYAQSVTAKIDQYMNASVKAHNFMGAILVAKDGKILIAKGYGMANVKHHIPNTKNTEFLIGSVTKQFTAMAILQLQAEGKLNVHDRICKYLPHCPKDWRPITIANLLDHTSGIPNFTSFPNYQKFQMRQVTPTQLLADFERKPLDFKPGTRFKYSNSGYVLLGYIIRRVSGQTYKQFLQKHIFDPLKMKNSGYSKTHLTAKNHATGYEYSCLHGHLVKAATPNMSVPYSAGGLHSTVRDLYTWDQALAGNKLLPKALHKQMFTPRVLMTGSSNIHYGFGWMLSREFGHREIWHSGGIPGFTALNSWYPSQHVYVIVLDNVSSGNIGDIGRALTAIVFGKTYQIPKARHAITLPAKALQKFVGTYRLAPRASITITRHGDQLKAQGTGQTACPIYPESKTEFFSKAVNAQFSFVTNAKGNASKLVLHQGGQNMPAKKIK